MSFNFDELLNQGKDAADLVTRNNREIDEVLNDLKVSISKFLDLDIDFVEKEQYEDEIQPSLYSVANILRPRKKTGYKYLLIEHEATGISKTLMTIKRSSEGYPTKVVHEKNNYSADNQSEFAQAVGAVIANPQTHLMFRNFIRAVLENTSYSNEP
ncbi:hypothetical protein P0F25_003487 [Vibrio metschnikovii]|nr:hypothetical protein [Vibrio metschnikovii]